MSNRYDVIIIGGGPAGLTSAVYALRAGKSVLVLEKSTFGGQITWSPQVQNFPTIISASGNEIGDLMMSQAMEQGAELELEEVVSVTDGAEIKTVECESGARYEAKAVIIATGAKPRMLGLPNEEELVGAGVCFCAVCDGAFYTGKPVAVNGGGNSALQDTLLLCEKCSKVYLVHRRNTFKCEAKLLEAAEKKSNVEIIRNCSVAELIGDGELKGIKLSDGRVLDVDGLFVAVGHDPQNEIFSKYIALDEKGYADSGEDCMTKTPGIFVAGDCRKKGVHQLTTAVADGATAALAACKYIDSELNKAEAKFLSC